MVVHGCEEPAVEPLVVSAGSGSGALSGTWVENAVHSKVRSRESCEKLAPTPLAPSDA